MRANVYRAQIIRILHPTKNFIRLYPYPLFVELTNLVVRWNVGKRQEYLFYPGLVRVEGHRTKLIECVRIQVAFFIHPMKFISPPTFFLINQLITFLHTSNVGP